MPPSQMDELVAGSFLSSLEPITRLFMEHSETAPLSLALEWCLPIEPILPVLTHFAENCRRWYKIRFEVRPEVWAIPAFRNISGNFPMLKQLHFTVHHHFSDHHLPVLDMLSTVPALTTVSCIPRAKIPTLPWVQIADLTLWHSYSDDALAILSQCHHLKHLTLQSVGDRDRCGTIPVSTTLDKVHSLSVISGSLYNGDDFGFVFKFLTLPSLVSVTFGSSQRVSTWDWVRWRERQKQIQQFLSRSRCSITSLRLELPELDDHQAVDLLLLLPTVGTLYLYDKGQSMREDTAKKYRVITPFFLQHLVAKDYSTNLSPFLPRLANLTLVVHSGCFDAESLCNAIISRWKPAAETGVCSLQSVTIRVAGEDACLETLSAALKDPMSGAIGHRVSISRISSDELPEF
uniref:F-box domain-containing protein n=1 Tax=Moniliophthora roreri TaxID=221103 RepID=A0A0W0FDT0_MONRR